MLLPLCILGTGCVQQDCFTKPHETETTQQMVLQKYKVMKKTTNERCSLKADIRIPSRMKHLILLLGRVHSYCIDFSRG